MNHRVLICLCLLLTVSSGCASKSNLRPMSSENYPECYELLNHYEETQADVATNTAAGVVLGALTGAAIGLISDGSVGAALIGAGAGALAGGFTGYAISKQQQIKDDGKRFAAYSSDISLDVQAADRQIVYARMAQECYEKNYKALLVDVKEGRISKDLANKRFHEIKNGFENVSMLLANSYDYLNGKSKQYATAIDSEFDKLQTQKIASSGVTSSSSKAPANRKTKYTTASSVQSISDKTQTTSDNNIAASSGDTKVSTTKLQSNQVATASETSRSANSQNQVASRSSSGSNEQEDLEPVPEVSVSYETIEEASLELADVYVTYDDLAQKQVAIQEEKLMVDERVNTMVSEFNSAMNEV